jgi:DNA-binding NarL/FixJ family response regulator
MKDKYLVYAVDDERMFLEMLIDELSENPKLEVVSFSSGEECIEKLDRKPDIIILDHLLNSTNPEAKDGMQILDEIRNVLPEVKIIILSAQPKADLIFDFIMKKDVVSYIVKEKNAFNNLKEEIDKLIKEELI